jgi:hypothetical protein
VIDEKRTVKEQATGGSENPADSRTPAMGGEDEGRQEAGKYKASAGRKDAPLMLWIRE